METLQRTTADSLLAYFEKKLMANFLPEREQTLVDALLLHFRNIAELAPLHDGEEIREVTAAQAFQLKVKTAALIRAAEDLMSLTRELKELWLFGPLRGLNDGETETNLMIEKDVMEVAKLTDTNFGKYVKREEAKNQKRN